MKRGSRPAASGRARSTRAQKPWIVPIHAACASRACSSSPSAVNRRRIRSRSSPAAFSVNVSARIDPTGTPSLRTASTNRSTITAVLPEPALAASSAEPLRSSIAARCSGVKCTPPRAAIGADGDRGHAAVSSATPSPARQIDG